MSKLAPQPAKISGAHFRVGIVAARYNEALVGALLTQVTDTLRAAGVKKSRLTVVRVPGSNETPIAAQLLASRGRLDVIIALGVIIRGDTIHYQLIAEASAQALQRVALDAGVPVINGVIAAENAAQAAARCRGATRRGEEFARAALEMAALKRALRP